MDQKRSKWTYAAGCTGRDLCYTLVALFFMSYVRFTHLVDIETKNMANVMRSLHLINKAIINGSRDNARTPIQLNNGEFAGFSNGKPWLMVNKNKDEINVEESKLDPNSLLNYYKNLIKAYKNYSSLIKEGLYKDLLSKDKNIFAYERRLGNEILLVTSNFSNEVNECNILANYKDCTIVVLLNNYQDVEEDLQPYQSIVYYLYK